MSENEKKDHIVPSRFPKKIEKIPATGKVEIELPRADMKIICFVYPSEGTMKGTPRKDREGDFMELTISPRDHYKPRSRVSVRTVVQDTSEAFREGTKQEITGYSVFRQFGVIGKPSPTLGVTDHH